MDMGLVQLKTALLPAIIALLVAASVSATVIPTELTEQKCGNKIREGYELCEHETPYDLCPAIGKMLKIAMVCNEVTCACLPGESAKNCGNGIREGAEMCDPGTKEAPVDFCPNISAAIGLPLKCDEKTCDCVASGLPVVLSTCGDSKIEGNEDCEADTDCVKGRKCDNCTCIRENTQLNLSGIEHNITEDNLSLPTIEDIIAQNKNLVLGFVIEDYVGEVIPELLDYFDNEKINIHIKLKNESSITVGVVTTETVVQEVHPYALNRTTMDIWLDEETAAKIKETDKRTITIVTMLEDNTIQYRPRSIMRRIWSWLFRPF